VTAMQVQMQTLRVERDGGVLRVTLNRPERRNAMSLAMVDELEAVLADLGGARVLVLRGAGGHFCAGGDVSDMASASAAPVTDTDPIATMNRRFGRMLQAFEQVPAAVVAVCEGGVMGGGFGLACVADVTLAVEGARFRLPETSLGLSPAQIAPFVVRRVGLAQARRLAVTGATLGAAEAVALGVAHERVEGDPDEVVARVVGQVLRCEPGAVAATKRLVLAVGTRPLDELLDEAAADFARLARRPEAQQGFAAFLAKAPPPWEGR
jgi:isohexenylglutaconyl-CoA hydratase